MRLIYLFHSGFLIEAEDFSIIFDYYRGGENIIEKALCRRQPMYVLVSHEHRDHYNPEILTWKNLKNNIHYIFPCEMSSLDELSGLPNIVYLDRGESYEDDRLRVNPSRVINFMPPAILRKTSFCANLNPTLFSKTASNIFIRRRSNPCRRPLRRTVSCRTDQRLCLDKERAYTLYRDSNSNTAQTFVILSQ